jgi:hypothetical protein
MREEEVEHVVRTVEGLCERYARPSVASARAAER